MRKISLSKTEILYANDTQTYKDFINRVFSPLKEALETLDNVTYVGSVNESTDDATVVSDKLLFDIGFDTMLLFVRLYFYRSFTFSIGLCKKDDDYTDIGSYTAGGASFSSYGNTTSGLTFTFVGDAFIVTKDNKFIAIYVNFTADNPSTTAGFLVCDSDNYGNKFAFIGGNASTVNELYYDNSISYEKHTVDATHVNNAIDGHVWLSNTPIFLNNSLKALTTRLLKICNASLSTNGGLCGTLIDVEGKRYRKLNYCWWVEDEE